MLAPYMINPPISTNSRAFHIAGMRWVDRFSLAPTQSSNEEAEPGTSAAHSKSQDM